jgi:hypothetical protein
MLSGMRVRRIIKRIATPIVVAIAILYFLIDALVLSLLRPVLAWLASLRPFARLRAWIESLGPYSTLALFLVPIILFEPVKPVGLYLLGTGRLVHGTLVLVLGEILKIVIVERLFHIAQPKLMSIRAFAVVYTYVMGWIDWLKALPPWQLAMHWFDAIKLRARLIARGTWRRLAALARGA